jgi:hypothetical protein
MNSLIRRQRATEATIARYDGKPFTWGRYDCARMAAFQLRGMGKRVSLLKGGRYSSPLGAAKALKRLGYADLGEAVDALGLPRIAPAAAIMGDLVGMPSEDGKVALAVAVGNGLVLGAQGGRIAILTPIIRTTAWRVDWRK